MKCAEKIWDHSSGKEAVDFYHRYKVHLLKINFTKVVKEIGRENKSLYIELNCEIYYLAE